MIKATGERGVVVEWINKTMLTVDVGGVSFPVYADQIDFPYFKDFTSKPEAQAKHKKSLQDPIKREKNTLPQVEKDGVWLSFFPVLDKDSFDEDIFSHFRIFLLNHTDDNLDIELSVFYNNQKDLDIKISIRALEELYLFNLPFERLNDHPRFDVEFSLATTDPNRAKRYTVQFKPKPKLIFSQAETVLGEQKASFRYPLFTEYPKKGNEEMQPISVDNGDQQPDDLLGLNKLAAAGFKIRTKTAK